MPNSENRKQNKNCPKNVCDERQKTFFPWIFLKNLNSFDEEHEKAVNTLQQELKFSCFIQNLLKNKNISIQKRIKLDSFIAEAVKLSTTEKVYVPISHTTRDIMNRCITTNP